MAVGLLNYHSNYSAGFFGGSATSSLCPSVYPVAIAGHPYQVIWDHLAIEVWGAKFKRNSLPLLRSQADQSSAPGAQSISPENFWPRSQESWISGAGQLKQDRKDSIETRFYTSKGIDPWTPYQLSLLNGTTVKKSSANTGLQVVVNGTGIYFMDGANLYYSSDSMANWTTVTGITGTPLSICSDGTTAYVSTATAIYSISGSVASAYILGNIYLCGFVKGRLMVASGTTIYNLIAGGGGALPTALYPKGTGWTWVGFAGGQSHIYAAGYSGDKSIIYKTAIVADGTVLAVPSAAASLPDGEIVRSIESYLSYIILGSDLGVRFCAVQSDGSLTIGALIPTTSPVYCFEPQAKFVWYGLTNYDADSTGLGRLNLETFTSNLTPAYASDLMVTGQGAVRSVKTFATYRIFTVDGKGLYAETLNTPVTTGKMVTGWINYDLSDAKVAVFLDLFHEPLNGTVSVALATDNAEKVIVGTSASQGTSAPDHSFPTNQSRGLQYQLTLTLTPTSNISPKVTRWTLRSYPAPNRSSQFLVPVVLTPLIQVKGGERACDIVAERIFLESLMKTQSVITYQQGNDTYQVVMYDYQFLPEKINDKGDIQGIFLGYFNEITS